MSGRARLRALRRRITTPHPRRRPGIRGTLGVTGGALVLLILGSDLALYAELGSVASGYETLLDGEPARQLVLARRLQLEVAGRFRPDRDPTPGATDRAALLDDERRLAAQRSAVEADTEALLQQTRDGRVRAELLRFRTEFGQLQADDEAAVGAALAGSGNISAGTPGQGDDESVQRLATVVDLLQKAVDDRLADQRDAVRQRLRLLALVGSVLLLALGTLLLVMTRHVVAPIRRLTAAARSTATQELPAAMTQVAAMAAGDPAPSLGPLVVDTGGEIQELSAALTSLRDAAVELAVDRRRRELRTTALLQNLGRRNQTLLGQATACLAELDSYDLHPGARNVLRRADRIATRIRRTAATTLVLAGAGATRTAGHPVTVAAVVRAAFADLQDERRVELCSIADAYLLGPAAADLTHLLAELLQNAVQFSPPTGPVTVVGQPAGDGYRIRVADHGIGITPAERAATNDRIRGAADRPTDGRMLGLHVVGLLAARNGLHVQLDESSDGVGTTATVMLPARLLRGPGGDPGAEGVLSAQEIARRRGEDQTDSWWNTPTVALPVLTDADDPAGH